MRNKRVNGWEAAVGIVRTADRLLNGFITIVLVVALAYGGFGLWDTWMIYKNAGVDSEILKYRPVSSAEEDAPNPTLSDLQKINPDVIAWLTVDGTNIDYPVVQGETNTEYLNKAVDGSFSLSGSIFLDKENAADFSDFYSLIYGHHMEGEVMFGEIPEFLEQEYFEEHTTGTLFLPDHTWQIRWFASVQTDAYDMQLLYPDGDMDEQARDELLDYIRQESSQYRELGVTADDRLIALSTCENGMTDGRDILIGQIIDEPDGETEGESEEGMAADSAAADETAAEETAGRRSDAK